ncbi:MAG TPA: Ig-like domain repeat protein [Candidatus Angelobacter sp.]|nr:Ig-like domain repeat protein [Candidatus Angelobacter sp.]
MKKLIAFLAFCLCLCAANSQSFTPAVNYPTGQEPRSVAHGDFNGDGIEDLIVANSLDTTLSLFTGKGDGTFNSPILIQVADRPIGIAAADLNGDGKLDLIIGFVQFQPEILFGNGDGTFSGLTVITLPSPFNQNQDNAAEIKIADFNGDGQPDIAFTGFAGAILVYLNSPGSPGTFGAPSAIVQGLGAGTVIDFYIADFGGPQHKDLVCASLTNNGGIPDAAIFVAKGNGDGTFASPVAVVPSTGRAGGFAVADFNKDGLTDLVWTSTAFISQIPGIIQVALQQPGGTFNLLTANTSVHAPGRIVAADLNGDGNPDLAVLQSSAAFPGTPDPDLLALFSGDGSGNFGTPTTYSLPTNPIFIATAPLVTSTVSDLVVADFSANELSVLLNASKQTSITTLVSSTNPSVFGQSITLSSTVSPSSGGSGTPTGTVTFSDGATTLATVTLTNGTASLTISSLTVASHPIAATYSGDANFLTSSAARGTGGIFQTVNQSSSKSTLSSTPNPSVAGQGVTFTATVAAVAPGSGTPSGIVTFFDNGTQIGSAALNSSRVATFTTGLAAGSHSITATYSGDLNFSSSSASGAGGVSQTVNQSASTTNLSSTPNPSISGQTVTFTAAVAAVAPGSGTPSGTVTFFDNGTQIGSAALNSSGVTTFTTGLAAGSHSITATYSGDLNFSTSSATGAAGVLQTVNKSPSTTTLSSTQNPSISGQPVTFMATVIASGGRGTPTGTATFLDNGSPIGTATLNAGSASLTSSPLPAGTHAITMTYAGDINFNASQNSVSQTVNLDPTGLGGGGTPEDFTITLQKNTAQLSDGQTFTTQVTLTPVNGLTGGVTTLCSGLPAGATCSLSPAQGTFVTTASLTSQLTITLAAAPSAAAHPVPVDHPIHPPFSPRLLLTVPLMFGIGFLMLPSGKKRFSLSLLLCGLLMGCGGNVTREQNLVQATPAGTYNITMQAQSGPLVHQTPFTLIVR